MTHIIQVAAKLGERVYTLPRPHRHDAIFYWLRDRVDEAALKTMEFGFITETGQYVSRQEAYLIAKNAGQLRANDNGPAVLVSEDLW